MADRSSICESQLVLKVARTIADLAGASSLTAEHGAEAIQYRGLDRPFRE